MKTANRILFLILVVAAALPIVVFATVPAPPNMPAEIGVKEYKIATATVALLAWLHISAALLFLMGIKGFKEQFRKAYKAICVGLFVYGLSLLQFPIIATLNLWQSTWSQYGGKAYPLILATLALFAGFRNFALALGIRSWITSYFTLLYIPFVALPTALLAPPERRIEMVTNIMCGLLGIVVMALSVRVYLAAGPAYKKSLRWLSIALVVYVIGLLIPSVIIALRVLEGAYTAFPFAITGVLLVTAGYSFNKIGESFFSANDKASSGSAKPVDALIFLASLASNPTEISPIMDDLREITADTSDGRPFTPEEQARLVKVYQRLVGYLAEQDQLRVFDKPLLIQKLHKRFPVTNPSDAWFWQNVN